MLVLFFRIEQHATTFTTCHQPNRFCAAANASNPECRIVKMKSRDILRVDREVKGKRTTRTI